jgi:hypothetical protein
VLKGLAMTRADESDDYKEEGALEGSLEAPYPSDEKITGTYYAQLQNILQVQLIEAILIPNPHDEIDTKKRKQAAIDALAGIAPKSEIEGMLAVQMVATHFKIMECYRLVSIPDQTTHGVEFNLRAAQRLSKLYIQLLSALNKHRGRGQQQIIVKHLHVSHGGQAIVGPVGFRNSQSGTVAGDAEFKGDLNLEGAEASGSVETEAQSIAAFEGVHVLGHQPGQELPWRGVRHTKEKVPIPVGSKTAATKPGGG